jgi:2-succinyl-6-hydroxy-2,4-cyclohexadiene-1-carboxylate synthase
MTKIYALHGFLGRPHDWEHVLPQANAVNLFEEIAPFWQWAESFNISITNPGVLIGYSLGGRLALHALLNQPNLWKAAIIISAHPGLETEAEKKLRFQQDHLWAERFTKDSWDLLMHDWNAQAVFRGDNLTVRKERDFDRLKLASALRVWSLANQENLMSQLSQLDIPIFWIAGSLDSKYSALYDSISLKHPDSKKWIAPNASHRVPWQQPKQFYSQIFDFLLTRRLL